MKDRIHDPKESITIKVEYSTDIKSYTPQY
jgi:hypothetical protein